MATAAITTRFMVQIEIGGRWKDRASYEHFSVADAMATALHDRFDEKVRVVQRETRDTVCFGWREGDKAMRR